jgi:hypothetical protein
MIIYLFTYPHCSEVTVAKIRLLMSLSTMSSVYTEDVEIWLQAFKILTLNGSRRPHTPVTLLNTEALVHIGYGLGGPYCSTWWEREKFPFWKLSNSCPAHYHLLQLRYSGLLNITEVQC